MNKTFRVTRHEFTHLVKTKGYIIISLLFPLLALAALGVYQFVQGIGEDDTEAEAVTIGYVDNVGRFDDASQTGEVEFIQYQSADAATTALLAGDIDEYFIIPPDYISTGQIDRFTLKREIEVSGEVRYAVRNFLLNNLFKDQVGDEMLERTKSPAWFNSTRLDETGQVSAEQGGVIGVFLVPYIFTILFWVAVLSGSFTLIEGLGDEKENRVMEILLSSVSAKQLILGKIIGLGAAGLLQIVFWFVSAFFLSGLTSTTVGGLFSTLEIPPRLIAFGLVYFVLGYLLFGVLFSVIGAIVPTYREGQQLSLFIIMPAVAPLMLIYFLVENSDHVVSILLTLFPLTTPIASIIRLAVGEMPVWQIVLSMFFQVLSIVVMFLIGTKIFRTYLLMYGKRPGFREILRSLRQA